tara:strand:- start:416 stop:532 length:117 start_codon:yes stop_codon:yes gene_type:complete
VAKLLKIDVINLISIANIEKLNKKKMFKNEENELLMFK